VYLLPHGTAPGAATELRFLTIVRLDSGYDSLLGVRPKQAGPTTVGTANGGDYFFITSFGHYLLLLVLIDTGISEPYNN